MAQSQLTVTSRARAGKGGARTLRREGLVPGVVYGKGMTACNVAVDPKALTQAIATKAGWNTLITLQGDGPFDGKVVILKDMQVHPLRREATHVDFQAVDLTQKVHVMVPVHAIGKSQGEKLGGQLHIIRHELEVVCLPDNIPVSIDIDVAALVIGDVVHINDVKLPAGVDAPHDVNFTVITVTGHKAEETEAAAEGVEA
ncbi:MAG: 50S ribosomal protein L25/general stress protein Ctc [Desulfuromonadales bacterium]|nr:50S ribosomal protein L25/general stress protein Ctc [Desulfuromonadales bacterium]